MPLGRIVHRENDFFTGVQIVTQILLLLIFPVAIVFSIFLSFSYLLNMLVSLLSCYVIIVLVFNIRSYCRENINIQTKTIFLNMWFITFF